jgi:hypothetical protein
MQLNLLEQNVGGGETLHRGSIYKQDPITLDEHFAHVVRGDRGGRESRNHVRNKNGRGEPTRGLSA